MRALAFFVSLVLTLLVNRFLDYYRASPWREWHG